MDTRRYTSLLVGILLVLPLLSPLLIAQANSIPYDVLSKIDPSLYRFLTSDQYVEIIVRVRPIPPSIARSVSGRYELAVSSLKSWAEISQRPIISTIASLGGKVLNRFWLDNVILALVPGHAIPKIASLPDVVRVFRNFEVKVIEPVSVQPIDPRELTPRQQVSSWGIFKIRAPEAWALGYTGQGVRIAVLDTGVDISHPALAGKMLTVIPGDPYYPGGWMAFDSAGNPVRTTPYDTHGHGTHCSGTALGGDTSNILIGVAPHATLMHGLVLPGGSGTFAQVLAGMQWTVEPYYLDTAGNRIYTGKPAHVVSMSFGAPEYYGNDLLPAIQAMLLANIVPVAAIGNDGPGFTSNPGNIWGVFGIGATDINDNVATWSSGKVVTWPSPPATWPFFDVYPSTYTKPDFSAPGVSITSAVPGGGYAAWSGTSMATPHVAGLVALMIQAAGWHLSPTTDIPEKIYLILNSTSIDFGTPGQDTRYGWGRVDAYEAVKKAAEYAKKSGVEGVVLDEITYEPVTWAEVTVVETGLTIKVNATGGFKIPLDPGNYTLLVSAWGYQPLTLTVEVVLLNGTIVGYVYNAITNTSVQGAQVSVVELNLTTYTDANGEFTISVPPGRYTLEVTATGYSPYSTKIDIDENQLIYLNIPLFPIGNGTVAGFVTHAQTGEPIQDAIVYTYVNGSLVYNFTDITGYYELNLPSGIYTVYAYKPFFIEANRTGVIVAPNEITWVNFTLHPIPPTVVVLANVHYYTRPHLRDIVAGLGLPVVEYNNMTKLLEDWMSGVINPAVVIVDHTMPDRFAYPPASVVLLFHQWADAVGSSIIWLGTSYSGYTGIDVLLLYNTTLVNASYPAPMSRITGFPSPTLVHVIMLNMTHPIFSNITPDIPPDRFYLINGTYADYAIYNFTDPTGRLTILGYVNDTRFANRFGVGVAEWISNTGKPWYYLGSWAESYWIQYIEPGYDGVYTNKTQRVLENAILLSWNSVVGSQRIINKELLVRAKQLSAQTIRLSRTGFRQQLYTVLTIYLQRQPYGFLTGRVVGSDGKILANATIEILNTPIRLRSNATGHFYTWLPTGTYTLRITAPGYKSREISATVYEGQETNLGDVVLPVTIRVATLYDYNGALSSFFESKGWYSRSYTNITELTNDILAGFYHLVVYSGYYYVPYPTLTEFNAFLNATLQRGVHVLWLDSWGDYGYGIKVLRRYLNDPATVGYGWGAPVYIRVTRPHPILRGYRVGQDVLIITYSSADYSWFLNFSGVVIADTLAGGVVRGNAIAYKELPNGVRWVLLSSFAPTSWNLPTYFTSDAWRIIYNAAAWAVSQPLNITLENPRLRVGDTLVAYISNAPAQTEIVISIDGVEVANVTTDNYGRAIFTYTVPVMPGGTYLLEAYTQDYLYYGYAEFTILPKITVLPNYVRTPGMIYVEATGLKPYQMVYIYVDGNWLSQRRANNLGSFATLINLPLLAEGIHSISIVDIDTGEELANATIYVRNQLDDIENIVTNIRDRLIQLEPIILNIDGNVATILTKIGVIQVDIDEIKQILMEHNAKLISIIDNIAVIQTDIGIIRATLEALHPIILSIHDMTYQIVVVLDTAIGEIKTDLETIKTLIETSRDAVLAKIDEGVATILLKIEDSTITILAKLDELQMIIEEIRGNTVEILTILGTVTADLNYIKSLLDEVAEVVAFTAEGVAILLTDVGYIKAKLDALEPLILEIHENTVLIQTQLGEIKASLEDLRQLIEIARDAILARIDEGVATILLKIEDSTITILAKLDELQMIIEEIRGNTVEILTILGTVTADLETIKAMLEDCHMVLQYIAETVAVIQTDVGVIKAKLEALEPIIIEIRDNIVILHTQLGEIQATLETIMNMIESAKEIILTEIKDGFAKLEFMIANSTTTIMMRLDELASLINETSGLIIERIDRLSSLVNETSRLIIGKIDEAVAVIKLELAGVETRIIARLSALEPIITRIDENVVYILTKLGELEANITTILSALAELDAKITQIKGDLVVIYTSIGELRVKLDMVLQNLALMNATIVSIMNDVVFIKTSAGQIIAKLDDLVNALLSVNASITGLIVQSRDSILVEISTSRGVIQADLSAIRALIEKGLPISTSELRDILSSLIRDTGSQIEKKIDNVGGRVDQVGGAVDQSNVFNLVTLILLLVTLALLGYQISLTRKTRL